MRYFVQERNSELNHPVFYVVRQVLVQSPNEETDYMSQKNRLF